MKLVDTDPMQTMGVLNFDPCTAHGIIFGVHSWLDNLRFLLRKSDTVFYWPNCFVHHGTKYFDVECLNHTSQSKVHMITNFQPTTLHRVYNRMVLIGQSHLDRQGRFLLAVSIYVGTDFELKYHRFEHKN